MGAYSTRLLSRQKALSMIMERLFSATNEELSEALFELTRDHILDNYTVYDTEAEVHAFYCCKECGICYECAEETCAVVRGEVEQKEEHPHTVACSHKEWRY